jgi:alpha-glucosidase/alpha-D-xyloside xylohydrolase
MYWEGAQLVRKSERPFALHRTGAPGMQRYGGWLWSGDIRSWWKTLRTQVANGLNTGISGIPLWGTDIGGFFPSKEFTAELYVRWFQWGAFCPLFRCHGRTWKTRLPWGWNTGDPGPIEYENSPTADQLRHPEVEPICRKYLELRYRLLPYLYACVRETHETGIPIMRALAFHYPDDPRAVARGDQFLWGRDILVAPVLSAGASTREVYLPAGRWYDFWTEQPLDGPAVIRRPVDLATMPLYVRAGAVLALAPVMQHTGEKPWDPVELRVYPGADGRAELYEDDGISFEFADGAFRRTVLTWDDARRRLRVERAVREGGKMPDPERRRFDVRLVGGATRRLVYEGRPAEAPEGGD